MAGWSVRVLPFLMVLLLLPVLHLQAQQHTVRADSLSQHPTVRNPSSRSGDRFWAPDKAQHFMGSLISTVLVHQILFRSAGLEKMTSRQMAVGFSFSLGVLKEVRDSRQPGNHFSWKDLLADAAGIAVGVVLINQP